MTDRRYFLRLDHTDELLELTISEGRVYRNRHDGRQDTFEERENPDNGAWAIEEVPHAVILDVVTEQ